MRTLSHNGLAAAMAAVLLASGPAWGAAESSSARAAGTAAQATDQRGLLLAQLRAGEATQRDDLVASALQRLRRIAPAAPEVLAAELRLALRQQQPKRAAALRDQLCRVAPTTRECANAKTLLRLAGPDADALRRATQQLAMGRNALALAGFRKLFAGDPPDFELAVKYWLATGAVPADRPRAISALEALDRRYPGNIELRQGLVSLLFWAGREAEALDWLGKLAADPRASSAAAQREFDYLSGLPAGRQDGALWRAFMQRFPSPDWTAKAKTQMAALQAASAKSGARARDAKPVGADVRAAVARAVTPKPHAAAPDPTGARVALLRTQAQAAAAAHDTATATALLREAHALAPEDAGVVRQWAAVELDAGQAEHALAVLESVPPELQTRLAGLLRRVRVNVLEARAEQATQAGDTAHAIALLRQAHALQPADPWIVFHLATAEREAGNAAVGDALFAPLLAAPRPGADTYYAHALYLAASDRADAALATLAHVPTPAWTEGMRDLDRRLRAEQTLAHARALHAARQSAAAERVLLATDAPSNWLLAADWARERGDAAQAIRLYRQILARDPGNAAAGLDLVDLLLAQHDVAGARSFLQATAPRPSTTDYDARRRLANAWLAVGGQARAVALFAALDREAPADPLLLRDAARAFAADGQPAAALDLYARAMVAEHLLPAATATPRNAVALTRASRAQDDDDWLARSLRADVDALYQAQNPTVTVLHDYAWRSDSTTPGSSDLTRQTTILNLTGPMATGTGFAQIERVGLAAGRFAIGADGLQHAAFGACALQWQSVVEPAAAPVPAGCAGINEAQTGYAFALGWHNDRWRFDLGHSPSGFAVGHWLGGFAYSNDWARVGYTLTFSRRPIDSTLLSYAGARDPATGTVYGGVVATGPTLNLSYDQGGANGVWAEFQQEALTGRNVPTNTRSIAMAGWYRRLVESANTEVRSGLTLMYWHYRRDLGEFTLGQAGYYSPQHYASIGVPFRVAHRSGNWSLDLDASVGWSWARFDATPLYPDDVVARVLGAGASAADYRRVRGDLIQVGSRSTGIGARLTGALERRLSSHWVLGGRVSYFHSQDYAPSDAMLYLRYAFHRWEGDLPLPIEPIQAYGDFK